MKIWILFLMLSFVAGGLAVRRGRRQHFWLTLGVCVVVAFALSSARWI